MLVDPLTVCTVSEPFVHFTTQTVFSDIELLNRLARWLHQFDGWRLQENERYSYYGFDLYDEPLSAEAQELASPKGVSAIVKICERAFRESFFPGVIIAAHKLIAGQYMGIHTDLSRSILHTHRLVVQIPGFDQVEGGDLLLFKTRTSEKPIQRYRPVANTGFGFEFCDNSFHALSPIIKGIRYSLTINLIAARGLSSDDMMVTLPAEYVRRLFLAENPAVKRGSRTLA